MVASPYSNSVRNLNLIRRWAGMWAPLVSLHRLDDEYEVPPYIVELMKDQPIHPTGADNNIGADARRLDTSRLGLQLSHMLAQLRQRMTPSQLGLGEETSLISFEPFILNSQRSRSSICCSTIGGSSFSP